MGEVEAADGGGGPHGVAFGEVHLGFARGVDEREQGRLREFAAKHREAAEPLAVWFKLISTNDFGSFAELRRIFGSVDKVGKFTVFDIGGNKFRLIVANSLQSQESLYPACFDACRIRSAEAQGVGVLAEKMDQVIRDYDRLRTVIPLGTLRTQKDYKRAVDALDQIIDEIGEDENHSLADVLGVFIGKYEAEHVRLRRAKPAAMLKFLMREHNIRQSDLPEIVVRASYRKCWLESVP